VGAGLQARPPHPPLAASGVHAWKAKRLTGDTSTTPVLTLDGQSIGDSTRIIAALEERWPQPPLYPPDAAQRQSALELEEFFDEELGPHIRRVAYQELLPHPGLVVPPFSHGQRLAPRILLRAGFPKLRVGVQRRFAIAAEAAQESRAKTVAAMDRLEREISPSGYLVGESFTVADLTAAALFYPVAFRPSSRIRWSPTATCRSHCASSATRSSSARGASGSLRSTIATASRPPSRNSSVTWSPRC
jgi:glutathione S-transferase